MTNATPFWIANCLDQEGVQKIYWERFYASVSITLGDGVDRTVYVRA